MITSADDLKVFIDYCKKYLDLFNLSDWKVDYSHKNEKNAYASCDMDVDTRLATINLSINLGTLLIEPGQTVNDILNEFAFHEVCHILLADICEYSSSSSIHKDEHSLINRLSKAFLGG